MSFTHSTANAVQEVSDNSVAAFERNAFRVLSLPADVDDRDIYRRQQLIQNALELGDEDVASLFGFLPELALSAEAVLEAVHRIEKQRVLEELFWVHEYDGRFDFDSGNVNAVLADLWGDAVQKTLKDSIAQHNLAVILTCLAHGLEGSRRVDYWRHALLHWNATLTNDLFWVHAGPRRTR